MGNTVNSFISNNRAIQAADSGGKLKLTAVTISHGNHRHEFSVMLEHDEKGAAKIPQHVMSKLIDKAGVKRGDHYTVS